ncbi:MAG: hypothetical protein JSW61_07675 [Candidatus Thorarchaeota archaeon]|nr:MAG: hypothetical protein JSW61_07675 [Candidatus Thorarchaeota archaeon]
MQFAELFSVAGLLWGGIFVFLLWLFWRVLSLGRLSQRYVDAPDDGRANPILLFIAVILEASGFGFAAISWATLDLYSLFIMACLLLSGVLVFVLWLMLSMTKIEKPLNAYDTSSGSV